MTVVKQHLLSLFLQANFSTDSSQLLALICIFLLPNYKFLKLFRHLLNKGRVSIKVWDLGGQPRFRSAWTRYCRGANAILFMIDASDRLKLQETKQELNQLLASPFLDGMPLLVLGNKSDMRGSFDHDELYNELNLDEAGMRRPLGFYLISCKTGLNIENSLQWLVKNAWK
ncbi:hypothetical protein ACQ4LE_008188 [Meloidogyne hapla]